MPRSVRREYEPGHDPTAAPPPAPPGGQGRDQFQSPAALRVPASRAQPRHPGPAAVGDLDPDQAVPGRHRDRDPPPATPEPLCRTLLPNNSLTSRTAASRHGCPGPSTPPVKARATRARSASPASVTLSRTAAPAINPPPSWARPARTSTGNGSGHRTDARSAQPRTSSRARPAHGAGGRNVCSDAAVRGRPWRSRRCTPTVRTVHTDRPNSTDARPLYVRGHRNRTPYSATR